MAGHNTRVSLGGSTNGSFMASLPTGGGGDTEARRAALVQAEEVKLMRTLELGAVMTLLSGRRGRPERRTFQVILETRQLIWSRTADRVEGTVDLREVREVRRGVYSERTPDDCEPSMCFVVLHGSEFRLKFVTIAGQNHEDVQTWILGLRWIVKDTRNSSSPLQIERWLRKQFYTMDRTKAGSISLKDLKVFLPNVNFKAPSTRYIRDKFLLRVPGPSLHHSGSPAWIFWLAKLIHSSESLVQAYTTRAHQPGFSGLLSLSIAPSPWPKPTPLGLTSLDFLAC
uniref:1-phosphatidylinositol 4,5-bisphosphate phosphodiesterase gamma-1-like n=1 Tax=Myxine glutinosa TaxID=7769 RepID=UPI00358F9EEC